MPEETIVEDSVVDEQPADTGSDTTEQSETGEIEEDTVKEVDAGYQDPITGLFEDSEEAAEEGDTLDETQEEQEPGEDVEGEPEDSTEERTYANDKFKSPEALEEAYANSEKRMHEQAQELADLRKFLVDQQTHAAEPKLAEEVDPQKMTEEELDKFTANPEAYVQSKVEQINASTNAYNDANSSAITDAFTGLQEHPEIGSRLTPELIEETRELCKSDPLFSHVMNNYVNQQNYGQMGDLTKFYGDILERAAKVVLGSKIQSATDSARAEGAREEKARTVRSKKNKVMTPSAKSRNTGAKKDTRESFMSDFYKIPVSY